MKPKTILIAGALVPIAILGALFAVISVNEHPTKTAKPDPNPLHLPSSLIEAREFADKTFSVGKPEEAIAAYSRLVVENEESKDPNVQDQVARARMHIGYAHAKTGDFKTARKVFTEVLEQAKGTETIDPSWGSLKDQAAYQAAVCLVAQGKEKEARREFRRIVAERPKSPVIYHAFRRMQRLGDPNKAEEELLQSSIGKQEAWMRFEISVCGPKTISYLLPVLGLPSKDYKEVAKLCGTNDQGTTIAGMRKGLKALGVETDGLLVNRKDFANLPFPVIWLESDHYTALLAVKGNRATVFDTRYACKRTVTLPNVDDPTFTATVLVIRNRPASAAPEGTPRR